MVQDIVQALDPYPDELGGRPVWLPRVPQIAQHIRVTDVLMTVTPNWELAWNFGLTLSGDLAQFQVNPDVLLRVQEVARDVEREKKEVMLWGPEAGWVKSLRERMNIRSKTPTAAVLAREVWKAVSDMVQEDIPPFLGVLQECLPHGVSFDPMALYFDDIGLEGDVYVWPRVNASLSSVTKGSYTLLLHKALTSSKEGDARANFKDQKDQAWRTLKTWESIPPENIERLRQAQGLLQAYMVLIFCVCTSNEILEQIDKKENPETHGPAPQAPNNPVRRHGTISALPRW